MAKTTGSCVSLDHLISRGQQRFRDGEAERLGRFEVDDQLELGRLQDRQGRLHLGKRTR